MNSRIDLATSWDREYAEQGIPSSWKSDPSNVVRWGLDNLARVRPELETTDLVLDVGCGTGRNSIAAASEKGCRVVGFDYSASAIEQASRRLADESPPVRSRVTFITQESQKGLPASNRSVALVMDIFVYFHLLGRAERESYRQELGRVLSPDGVLLMSLATVDDGYYSTCPPQKVDDATEGVPIVLDQSAGVGNVMHSLDSLRAEMSDHFDLAMLWEKVVDGPMHGETYERHTLATLWRPRPLTSQP